MLNILPGFQSGQTVDSSGSIEQPLGLKRHPQRGCKIYFIFLSLPGTRDRDLGELTLVRIFTFSQLLSASASFPRISFVRSE